ncbi:phage regulatory protein, rha family [Pseudovibrio denitrificans]|uniref:Phage regulatory protein, rha family n=1 Tax=Pseudovibrio denitrificans TaxID=258256 RepID=A0A1I6Y0N4_9HYPH|nr:Rha family transcriptional regulator [Pseudovibrio denitrificans]SFT43986.1 phage regulatory protein, rha family [Pseudovibrio denitrificans]
MQHLIKIENGKPVTDTLVIAEVFGRRHDEVLRSVRGLINEGTLGLREFASSSYLNAQNKEQPMYQLSEKAALIAMPFIGGRKSKEGQRKLVEAFLEYRDRRASSNYDRPPQVIAIEMEMAVAEAAGRALAMSDSSKLKMIETVANNHGCSTNMLPDYVDEKTCLALTTLLKEIGENRSARAVNKVLLDLGILEERTRTSTSGKEKRFKLLTEKGLSFGKNQVSPNNPRETQPLYYISTFADLMQLIDVADRGEAA